MLVHQLAEYAVKEQTSNCRRKSGITPSAPSSTGTRPAARQPRYAGNGARTGAGRRPRPRQGAPRLRPRGDHPRRRTDQRRRLALGRIRRHLPRRRLPPGQPDHRRRAGRGTGERRLRRTFLRGVIVGYEISTRIGESVMPSHYKYWHTTGTVGSFGTAAAVATILELNATQIAHALATVATMAAGLQQAYRMQAMSKPLHSGHAAEVGALAAMAAAKGVTGAADILEGEVGFGNAMSAGRTGARPRKRPRHATTTSPHDLQEPRLLRPHFRADRRRAASAENPRLQVERHQTHEDRHLQGRHRHRRQRQRPKASTRPSSASSTSIAHALVHGSVRLVAFSARAHERPERARRCSRKSKSSPTPNCRRATRTSAPRTSKLNSTTAACSSTSSRRARATRKCR